LIALLMAAAFILSGCVSTLVVRQATVAKIIPVFKDYVGTRGYQLTYENAATGQYRVNMGSVYVQGVSETTKSKTVIVQPPAEDSNLPLTSYEDTTWRTFITPAIMSTRPRRSVLPNRAMTCRSFLTPMTLPAPR